MKAESVGLMQVSYTGISLVPIGNHSIWPGQYTHTGIQHSNYVHCRWNTCVYY